jgi:ATP-dependent Zn protease
VRPKTLTQHERKVHEMTARLIERRHMDASEFKRLMEAPD